VRGPDGSLHDASKDSSSIRDSGVDARSPGDATSPRAPAVAVIWIIGTEGVEPLDEAGVGQVFASAAQPRPQILLDTRASDSGVFNACGTDDASTQATAFPASPPPGWDGGIYVYRYTAECQLERDLKAPGPDGGHGAIPGWITWVMYDNELCTEPPTPVDEQADPPYYYPRAANAAHDAGLKFYATAGLHRRLPGDSGIECSKEDPSYLKQPDAAIRVSQLWATAYLWDGVDFQVQTGINDPDAMVGNTKEQLRSARVGGLPTLAIVAAGIGDLGCFSIAPGDAGQVCGPVDPGTEEEAVRELLDAGVQAFWGNYGPHPKGTGTPNGTGNCTDPNSDSGMYALGDPYRPCAFIEQANYGIFAQVIEDIAAGVAAPALGPYGTE
jgi:hypothetical protein